MVELDNKKTFEVLLDALKDAYKELLELGLKISGVVLIVLGWFASKTNPLSFLCGHVWLAYGALFCVAVGYGLICFLLLLIAKRAEAAYNQLMNRGFEGPLFERFRITRPMLIGGLASQALLLGGVFAYILFEYVLHHASTCT